MTCIIRDAALNPETDFIILRRPRGPAAVQEAQVLKRVAWGVVRLQLMIGIAGAALWLLMDGPMAALAAMAGAGISALLSFHFAARMLANGASSDPKAALGAFYRAEAMKLTLGTALIFIAVYLLRDDAVPLVTTLAATLAAYWLALLRGPA